MNKIKKIILVVFGLLLAIYTSAQKEENIVLETTDCTIDGTVLVPEVSEQMPLVILVSGSGPTDRNGNNPVMSNNSLKMLAEELAKHNIASLRYDKRGIGKSANNSVSEKDLRFEHYINDLSSWIEKLSSDQRFSEIVIIGHSEGALIGAVASQTKLVSKYISIAGTGNSIDKTLKEQLKAQPPFVLEQANPIIDSLAQGYQVNNVPDYLNALFRPSVQPYLISWMKYDPCEEVKKLDIPVLIVQGTTDIQVRTDDAKLLSEANKNAKMIIIDGMNHILKPAELERNLNIATYSNPTLPLHDELVGHLSEFILQ